MKKVGIVGLGLIGGSFAKAYHAAGWEVFASNRTKSVLEFAILSGDVNGELTRENVGDCDLVLVTIYPEAAIRAIRDFIEDIWYIFHFIYSNRMIFFDFYFQ